MKVDGKWYRTIWRDDASGDVCIIDQRWLPHEFIIETLKTVDDMDVAIREMHVRGAGLIGASAAYGVYLAARSAAKKDMDLASALLSIQSAAEDLCKTRPTAVNLRWAVDRQLDALRMVGASSAIELQAVAERIAQEIADEDADFCKRLGEHGAKVFQDLYAAKLRKSTPGPDQEAPLLQVLTHCNAGWLAFVDWGSALSPVYVAQERGVPVHVWVDETRPRNQGASLTAWELSKHGVPHTVIADNTAGHLMQHSMVDIVITGADRVTRCGDVCNKIGTYTRALCAVDNDVPFYVALPSSTFDWKLRDGMQIPIEQRNADEVRTISGVDIQDGVTWRTVRLTPKDSRAANYGFDVTPARLLTGLITERGVMKATEDSILELYPERMGGAHEPEMAKRLKTSAS